MRQMVGVVTWQAQYRETQDVEVWSYGLASPFTQHRHKATKSLPRNFCTLLSSMHSKLVMCFEHVM